MLEHRNPTSHDYFTTTVFHHPDELRAEVAEAGFSVEAVLGVEDRAGRCPTLPRAGPIPRGDTTSSPRPGPSRASPRCSA
jgi:hypothetical protein